MSSAIAFIDYGDDLFSIFVAIENCAVLFICCSGRGGYLSPPSADRPGPPNHNKTGKLEMRMISEKAIAFLLAVVISGTAFNTFIV